MSASKTITVSVRTKRGGKFPKVSRAVPISGQPGFNLSAALAETRRIAAATPYGKAFFSPATGGLVMNSKPFTESDVYACY